MSKEDNFVDADHVDEGPYTSSHHGEQALNAAIIQAARVRPRLSCPTLPLGRK